MIGISVAISAFLVGLLWTIAGVAAAVGVFAIGGFVALAVGAVFARRAWRRLNDK